MSTSKYGQDASSERDIGITIGESHIHFTVGPISSNGRFLWRKLLPEQREQADEALIDAAFWTNIVVAKSGRI